MEKDPIQDFLGEHQQEVNPFEENLKDPFENIREEKVEEPQEEKPIAFNKDPKIQKFIEKEINKRLENLKPSEPTPVTQQDDDDYYVRLIGNDTPEKLAMIREAKARDEKMLNLAEERAFGRLTKEQQAVIEADQEAERELENAFESIEESYDVDISSNNPIAKKTRQEFVSFVEKIAPKDRNGNIVEFPDMQNAWETFSEIKKSTQQPSRAKDLASRSLNRSAETTIKPQERVSWKEVDTFMDTLK